VRPVLLACALAVLATQQALAWGPLGHQAIGEAAQSALTDKAQQGLARVFGHGDQLAPGTLAKVATWPDDVRARMASGAVAAGWDAADIKEADRFYHDHKGNTLWHFVNLPLGAAGYPTVGTPASDPVRQFVRPDDIVQIIKRCIEILESPTVTPQFSKVQAVRWLVQLAGCRRQRAVWPALRHEVFEIGEQRHWMISSARASTDGGMVRPSAFAVLRLITNSNFVGACNGRSAGFSPLRMRSMYPAARRNCSLRTSP